MANCVPAWAPLAAGEGRLARAAASGRRADAARADEQGVHVLGPTNPLEEDCQRYLEALADLPRRLEYRTNRPEQGTD